MIDVKQSAELLRQEQDRYDEFVRTHPKSRLDDRGQTLEYIACGAGPRTVLMPPHISGLFPPELGYRQILEFEKKYRVIAPSLIDTDSLDEIAASLLHVVEKEKAGPVILFGQSGSGITAQLFFQRYFQHVAGMILVNTVAPGRPAAPPLLLTFLRLLPAPVLKYLLKRSLAKLANTTNIPPEIMPRVRISQAILDESFRARFSKKRLINDLRNVLKFRTGTVAPSEALGVWPGRILIVTSKDDPGHEDSRLLSESLPRAELLELQEGYGHLAPAVKQDEVHRVIGDLIAGLDR